MNRLSKIRVRNSTLTSKAFPFRQVRSHIAVIAVRSASAICIFCSGLLDFRFLSFGPSRFDFYAVSSCVGHSIAHVQTVQARRRKNLSVRKVPGRRVYSKVYFVSTVYTKLRSIPAMCWFYMQMPRAKESGTPSRCCYICIFASGMQCLQVLKDNLIEAPHISDKNDVSVNGA